MYTGKIISLSEQQLIDCDHAPPYEDEVCPDCPKISVSRLLCDHAVLTVSDEGCPGWL